MPGSTVLPPIAVVDDEPGVIDTYRLLFSRRQIPLAFIALDGYEALEMFRRADPKPRVVILDYKMPYMNGLEVMAEILKMAPDTKILMIAADEKVMKKALEAGAKAFLLKPVSTKVIIDTVRGLLSE